MKLPKLQGKFKWNYTALSFLLPTTVMLVIFFITSVTPFGSQTLLYSDNFHQYFPFFRQFRQALRSGDGLLWTWSVGMGMDYLGLIAYYLGSPLNLLSVLVPDKLVLTYFTLLMPIKLGLASGFFAIMVKKLFGTDDLSLPLFGSFYAMCAWALGYQWNIMWLDTFALLPLLALGTILLLRDGKYLLYTLVLALSIMANYYVGFFVCIFVFLLFWCYEICRFKGVAALLGDLVVIGFFTVLAIGMTAILEWPALMALQDTYSGINKFPTDFELNMVASEAEALARDAWYAFQQAKELEEATFSLWLKAVLASFPPLFDGMRQVAGQIGGGQTPTYIEGLPNLYCGVFPVALGWLFLLSKEVKWQEKVCSVFLLVLFMLSFLIRQLDYIWHGFHFTNQIPYRFSFLFSFVVLFMAYKAWTLRNTFSLECILLSGLLAAGVLIFGGHSWTDYLYWLFNFAFLGLYLICMIAGHSRFALLQKALRLPSREEEASVEVHLVRQNHSRRRKWAQYAIASTMVVELVLHTALFFSGFSIADYDYPKRESAAETMFEKIPQLDDGSQLFYRTEVTHAQTLNDGALNGYHGISTFTSSANVATTEFMQCMGAGAYNSWNRYCYEEGSPVSNLFLNLKYLVERDNPRTSGSVFDVVLEENGLTLLQNSAYLPLGFLTEPALADLHFSTGNHSFTFQNNLFKAATGISTPVWRSVYNQDLTVTASGDVDISKTSIAGYTSFSTGSKSGTLFYTYNLTQEGFLCLDLNLYKHKNFSVWHNGKKLYDESFSLEQMMAVGDVKPGDTVEVQISCAANMPATSVSIRSAVMNTAVFREGYEILNASTLRLTEFSSSRIRGTIDCNRDGLLYTSVPQDGNWVAYVDGKEVPITLVGECMISLPLTAGQHTVELRYENEALRTGAWITAASAFLFAAFMTTDYLLEHRKKAK